METGARKAPIVIGNKVREIIFLLVFLGLVVSCGNNQVEKKEEHQNATIDSSRRLSKNYFKDCKALRRGAEKNDSILLRQTEIDKTAANNAIKAFTDFAYYCQNDSLSPIFLIKTAQVARAINNIPQAKIVLDRCIANYPSFNNRAAAIFLLAQLYDENSVLNDEHEAKRLYEQIITEYPKSDWAQSAKGAITFLGKSDEEIMKELKKKNK